MNYRDIKDELLRLYVTEEKNSLEIAKIYNTTANTVLRWLKNLNIPTRTISASMKTHFKTKPRQKGSTTSKITKKCSICSKELQLWPYRVKENKTGLYFCSGKCRGAYQCENLKGENAYNWRGGIYTQLQKKRGHARYTTLRKKIIMRDGRCGLCGSRDELVVHHIDRVTSLDMLYDEEKMITLCDDCHRYKVNGNEEQYRNLFIDMVAKAVNSVKPLT